MRPKCFPQWKVNRRFRTQSCRHWRWPCKGDIQIYLSGSGDGPSHQREDSTMYPCSSSVILNKVRVLLSISLVLRKINWILSRWEWMLNLKRGQTAAGRRKEKRREKIPRIFLVPQHRRLGQHSKHQQSSKSLSFRVWLSCTLISYAHTINIVCHHLITRESVRNAYGRSRNPISHSCILSLPRTTYLKRSDSIFIMTRTEWLPKE